MSCTRLFSSAEGSEDPRKRNSAAFSHSLDPDLTVRVTPERSWRNTVAAVHWLRTLGPVDVHILGWVAAVLRIPFSIIAPVIVVVCAIGAYTINSSMFDVGLMLFFGVLGYAFKKLGYPIAPLVLASILGDKAEDAFRQSMLFSDGHLTIFWSNPLVGSLTTAALLLALWPLLSRTCGALFEGLIRKSP